MKLLLINPFFPYAGSDKFPLGIAYIAGIAQRFYLEIVVVDENINDSLSIDQIVNSDLIGISITTPAFSRAKEIIAECIKHRRPSTFIFCGGHHPTFCAEELLGLGVDLIFREEAEISFNSFLERISSGIQWFDILGITYCSNSGQIINNPLPELIQVLDSIPFPNWNSFNLKKYPVLSVTTSRGCPFRCSYCAAAKFWHNQIRFRSVENIISEIEVISKIVQIKEIKFQDSVFTINKNRTISLLNEFIQKNYPFHWSCETRADTLDPELIVLMKKAGCNNIMLGLESGSQSILDDINRNMKIDSFIEICKQIMNYGIGLRISVIFGLPTESASTVEETLSLLRKISPNVIFLNLATIYPGCSFQEIRTIKNHSQWIADFEGHGRGGQQILPKNMTPDEYRRLATYMKNEIHLLNKKHWQI